MAEHGDAVERSGGEGDDALVLDPEASRVVVRTAAEGLFARLAHDLELGARLASGTARRVRGAGGETWAATVELAVSELRVRGVRHGDRVDEAALSPGDRAEIERRLREDVFAGLAALRVEGELRGDELTLLVHGPRPARVTTRPARERAGDGGARVHGAVHLSLRALGAEPPKGPMGAFRVKDDVEVAFDVAFRPR